MNALEFLLVQDLFYTKTAELADIVLPAAAGAFESEGTVTSSERCVQRERCTVPPPVGVRDDLEIIFDLARRLGHDWGTPDPEAIWNELRTLRPMHGGMSYRRLEEMGRIQWPCYDESHPGEMFLYGRLWSHPVIGPRALFTSWSLSRPWTDLTCNIPSASLPAAGSMITIPACKQENTRRRCGAKKRWTSLPKTLSAPTGRPDRPRDLAARP